MSASTAPRRRRLLAVLTSLALLLLAATAWADEGPEVTNGGYMQTTDAAGKALPLPLEHTDVAAQVAGFVASVTVTQTFVNPTDGPIEAVYVFPLPQRAAVYDMRMVIGERVIQGKVHKRAEARKVYEAARAAGKAAALLDQERPNIFTQSVANILPNEKIRVELSYVEDLNYRGGEYEFVFPMVVGPRFIPGNRATGHQGTGWAPDTDRVPDASRITPPLLKKGQRPGNDIAVRLELDAGMAIEGLNSPSHDVRTERPDGESAVITLSPKDTVPNKDFVVRYRVAGRKPRVALLTQKDERGGHFLLMLQPSIPDKRFQVAPREYVFVVDTSGSMRGFPLQQAKEVMRRCLTGMRKQDRFQVVGFAGSASFLFKKPMAPTKANVADAIDKVDSLRGGGGTRFLPALDLALNAPRDPGRARVVLFLSDAYIGYENEVLRYLRSNLRGANLFTMGVGSSVNRFLIESMARIGQAEPFYLLNRDKPEPVVKRFYDLVSRPSLTDIEIDWGMLDVDEVTPAYLADLFADRPLFVVGRYEEGGRGKVTVRGRWAGKRYAETIEVDLPDQPHGRGAGIAYLWARRQIADLMDLYRIDPKRKAAAEEAVTSLALRFNLMSKFTSFVAVDESSRTQDKATTVPVAVPLPQGVEESAAPAAAFASAGPITTGMPKRKAMVRPGMMAPRGGFGGMGISGKGVGGGGAAPAAMAPPSPSPRSRSVRLSRRSSGLRGGRRGRPRAGVPVEHEMSKPTPAVTLLAVRGPESLSKAALQKAKRALTAKVKELLAAYQAELEVSQYARGKVTLRLKLDSAGRVVAAKVVAAPFGGQQFKDALVAKAKGWSLPKDVGEQVLVLTLQFGG